MFSYHFLLMGARRLRAPGVTLPGKQVIVRGASVTSRHSEKDINRIILVAGDFENSGTAIAWRLLQAGESALEALEQGIRAVEANLANWSVGVGGFPNALGVVEVNAGVMDGRDRSSGAVGALTGFIHPVSVAYAVRERLPGMCCWSVLARRVLPLKSARSGANCSPMRCATSGSRGAPSTTSIRSAATT